MSFFENMFNFKKGEKKEEKEVNLSEKEEEEKEEVIMENKDNSLNKEEEKLSFTENLELLEKKKQELKKLQEERLAYYVEAKNFEDKMNSLGLSAEKKLEIREQIMTEGGEISNKIQAIRDEYGFEATAVEVYSTRLKMLNNELDRIVKNPSYDRHAMKSEIETIRLFRDIDNDPYLSMSRVNNFSKKYPNIQELQNFNYAINEAYEKNNGDERKKIFTELKEDFQAKVDKNIEDSIYKNNADLEKASLKVLELYKLINRAEDVLYDAKNGTGRFKNEK